MVSFATGSCRAWLAMAATVLAEPAVAQEIVLTGPLAGAPATRGYSVTPGAKGGERMILPSGHMELGGEMALVMSDARNGVADDATETLRFTDIGLLRLRMRRSFADWLELYGATRSSQSSHTGGTSRFGKRLVAARGLRAPSTSQHTSARAEDHSSKRGCQTSPRTRWVGGRQPRPTSRQRRPSATSYGSIWALDLPRR